MRIVILAPLVFWSSVGAAVAAPLVYSGRSVTFSKAEFADTSDPAGQDFVVPGIVLTRGNLQGLFNIAFETSYGNTSPLGTRWAFKNNNGGVEPSISNWATLTFDNWQTALGGGGVLATNITDGGAVVHLVDQDIYLELRFTDWGVGSASGGRFAYERAEIVPTADFDRDADSDGHDFLTWQRGLGIPFRRQFEGDANFDGVIDAADLAIWQNAYGPLVTTAVTVPEPSPWLLAALAVVLIGTRGSI